MNFDHFTKRIIHFGIISHLILISLLLTIILHSKVKADADTLRPDILNFQNWDLKIFQEKNDPVNFLFVGDIMLGRYIAILMDKKGEEFPFKYMQEIRDFAQEKAEGDLHFTVGNLEGPITDSNYVNPGTAMIFNFKPAQVLHRLKNAGFTTLSMANNHTLDMGSDGVESTLNYLNSVGIDAFGHPKKADYEFNSLTYEENGIKISFLGLNEAVYGLNVDTALQEISRLSAESDFLIVSVHWGPEYLEKAPVRIEEMARKFIDAGADFIHGHHPHRVQNMEEYNGAPIYYSLGNFVFDQYWSSYTQEGQIVLLQIQKEKDSIKIEHESFMVDLVEQGAPRLRE